MARPAAGFSMRALVPLLFGAVVVVGACGGGDDGDEAFAAAREYVDAAMKSYDAEGDMSPNEARCFAEGFVEVIGIDKLHEEGILPDEFIDEDGMLAPKVAPTREQAERLSQVLLGCIDLGRALGRSGKLSALSAEEIECFGAAMEQDEEVRAMLVDQLFGARHSAHEDNMDEASLRAMAICEIDVTDLARG